MSKPYTYLEAHDGESVVKSTLGSFDGVRWPFKNTGGSGAVAYFKRQKTTLMVFVNRLTHETKARLGIPFDLK